MKYYTFIEHEVGNGGARITRMIQNISEHKLMMIHLTYHPDLIGRYVIIEQERAWTKEESQIETQKQFDIQDECNRKMLEQMEEYRKSKLEMEST